MRRILILTVGGSHQPIVRSIQQNRPDFTCFLCSADSGKNKGSHAQVIGQGNVCSSRFGLERPDLPNIVTQTQLANDTYAVREIADFDNLSDCYLAAYQWIEQMHRDYPDATIIVDYTGGTKSMTAGLAAAALDDGQCEIQLVSGVRQDLVKVVDQTEFVRPVQVWDAQLARRLRLARTALARYDYVGAVGVLEDAAARFASPTTLDKVQRWLSSHADSMPGTASITRPPNACSSPIANTSFPTQWCWIGSSTARETASNGSKTCCKTPHGERPSSATTMRLAACIARWK
jgi:hypothetical protein